MGKDASGLKPLPFPTQVLLSSAVLASFVKANKTSHVGGLAGQVSVLIDEIKYEIGLVNRVAPLDRLDRVTRDLAEKIATKSPLTLRIGKRAFYEQIDKDLGSAYKYCSQVMAENMMARDAAEGIDAFLEKRVPVWTGE